MHAATATPKGYLAYYLVAFKMGRLRARLGLEIAQAYSSVDVPAGRSAKVAVRIGDDTDAAGADAVAVGGGGARTIEWDWSIEHYEVDFSASWTADGGRPELISPDARHAAADGPVEGRLDVPRGGAGTLTLRWSNEFSYVRAKAVSYRLVLPGSMRAPAAVVE